MGLIKGDTPSEGSLSNSLKWVYTADYKRELV